MINDTNIMDRSMINMKNHQISSSSSSTSQSSSLANMILLQHYLLAQRQQQQSIDKLLSHPIQHQQQSVEILNHLHPQQSTNLYSSLLMASFNNHIHNHNHHQNHHHDHHNHETNRKCKKKNLFKIKIQQGTRTLLG